MPPSIKRRILYIRNTNIYCETKGYRTKDKKLIIENYVKCLFEAGSVEDVNTFTIVSCY